MNSPAIRIQRKRTKGWKMPPNTIYVGRPSRWGNPWTIQGAVGAKRHLHLQKHGRVYGEPSHGYSLDLGRAPGGCFVCGDEGDLDSICFGRMTPLLEWSLPVCKTHRNSPHPKDPAPSAMITPTIKRWLERHGRIDVLFAETTP